MPRASHFNQHPPFPDDVVVADIPRLSLTKLFENDALESEQLFRACRETGFFLLDLTGSGAGENMLDDAEKVFDLSRTILGLEPEELEKFPFKPKENLFGYKRVGTMKLEDGSPDSIAFYGLGQDDMLGTSTPRPNPEVILANRKTFQNMFHDAYGITCHLFSHLEHHLSLKPGILASLCPQDKPSGTLLRMLRSPPQKIGNLRTNLIAHTDLGAMTILFNIVGGLQLLPADSENVEENWVYIRPEPGCAVINLGDAMVQWSGGILRSNIHRVATPPGQQASCPRDSLAYFLRAEAAASMRRLEGGDVIPRVASGEHEDNLCAQDWERMRAAQIVAGNSLPKSIGGQKL